MATCFRLFVVFYEEPHLRREFGKEYSAYKAEYLDETRPEPKLLPAEPRRRAVVRWCAEIVNSIIQPMHNYAVREQLKT